MLEEGARQFDLYDFFSVLVPGGAFVLGLFPFIPQTIPIASTASIILLLLLSFVVGRALHALGLLIESPLEDNAFVDFFKLTVLFRSGSVATNHRDYFANELCSPNDVSPGLVDEFFECASSHFSVDSLPDKRSDLDESKHYEELESLYTLVRSVVHMDARGRSRSFQAVLDFQRTMMVASGLLAFIYIYYGLVDLVGGDLSPLVGYQTYISTLDISPFLIIIGGGALAAVAYTTFERVRSNYRRYFIQYLLADFVNIYRAD